MNSGTPGTPAYVVASPVHDRNKVLRGNTQIEGNFKLNRSSQPPDLDMSSGGWSLAKGEREMQKQKYCVYNKTRESFLSLGLAAADTTMARLKGLIGKLTLGLDEGLWIVPSRGIHTVGVLFPLDLVYLDESYKVIHVVESFPTFRISPIIAQAASVLELPTHTIYSSQTQPGDQLVICVAEEMEQRLSTSTPNLTSRAQ
jgi:uncharacterized membrane protein (UPF0127 family)